jgi:hypothetical protein
MANGPKVDRMNETGIIHYRTELGHKGSYAWTLRALTGYEVKCGERSLALIRELISAKHVIFSTLDDDYVLFFVVSFLRMLTNRPTTGLFLRPQTCFGTMHPVQLAKRMAFWLARVFQIAEVLVIVPFEVAPTYSQVARDWVYDPEFWDLNLKLESTELPSTPLSDEVLAKAAGRAIISLPGTVLRRKGLSLITGILEVDPEVLSRILFVCSGRVPDSERDEAARFENLGGMLVPRTISDDELFSLYQVADLIWAAYAPEYDQSSGVFGRALQTGCLVAVRRGSLLERLARSEGLTHVALEYEEPHKAMEALYLALACRETATRRIDAAGNAARLARFHDKITAQRRRRPM